MPQVLAICLDGYEDSVGQAMMNAGRMPALRALSAASARFRLDHGPALRTGLAGEHVATGLSPAAADRWAAVHFDPTTYAVRQEGTALTPFPAALAARTVVFDPPYFDLARAPGVRGIVGWGAHDPGVASLSHPGELLRETTAQFGSYPARQWIYGTPWNSPERTRQMGDRLAEAVSLRARIARWLYQQRLPDWDLALLTVSEAHSAIEGLWHGIDPSHPLHGCPSAAAAGAGIRSVYAGIDALIADMGQAFPAAVSVVFSMHGMGPNRSDAGSMLLLAELLYRRAFGRACFDRAGSASPVLRGRPAMAESDTWDGWIAAGFPPSILDPAEPAWLRAARYVVPRPLRPVLRALISPPEQQDSAALRLPVDWMPATRYQPFWSRMPAFALPSFYDGRVRVNLKGREKAGVVDPADYRSFCAELVATLRACRDPVTGEGVVEDIEHGAHDDPRAMGPTEADLIIIWRGAPLGLVHADYGQIGPVPYRRTGGHTGGHGFALIRDERVVPGDRGVCSAYDVVPTLIELLGEGRMSNITGTSLVHQLHRAA